MRVPPPPRPPLSASPPLARPTDGAPEALPRAGEAHEQPARKAEQPPPPPPPMSSTAAKPPDVAMSDARAAQTALGDEKTQDQPASTADEPSEKRQRTEPQQ